MGQYRFVNPETKRYDLDGGDWVEVKERLTVGEYNQAKRADAEHGAVAWVAMYLVDWSFKDADGKDVPLGESHAARIAALNNMSLAAFNLLDDVVGNHMKSVKEADDAGKKDRKAKRGSTSSAAA